jgi:neutral/alkaline ceramidase-like enzyme
MRNSLWILIVLALVCFSSALGHAAEADADAPVFRAGAATATITPPLGVQIVGNWKRPTATYIHDDLHARSLVLDDGERRLAIVICDNLHMNQTVSDQARERLQAATGIPAEHMLMASTHTHSGPSFLQHSSSKATADFGDYEQFIVSRIVDSVLCAIDALEPAQIGWGRGEAPGEVNNRRWYLNEPSRMVNPFGGQDKVRMNPPRGHKSLVKPAGPIDPEIVILSVRSAEGRPIALLANYSLHYVGGVPAGHISADYFGAFADRIQELLGADRLDPPFVGILSNGTSGDINNINFRNPSPKRKPYEQIHRVANIVADEVYKAYQSLDYHDHVQLGGRMSELTLKARKPDEATIAWARAIQEKPEEETELKQRIYAGRTLGAIKNPETVDIRVQALRIGDVGIAAIPFEVFVETGLGLKKDSPLPVTFTISHSNGSYGYLPTPAQHELGGYETWLGTNRVAEDSEPAITARLLEQLGELAAE